MNRRVYECQNRDCPQFGLRQVVSARPVGIFWEWPVLFCECGFAPFATIVTSWAPINVQDEANG